MALVLQVRLWFGLWTHRVPLPGRCVAHVAQRSGVLHPSRSVAGKEACEKRLKLAADTGGVARFGPFAADGWICIVQDPQGAFCGVYSREDVWDAVKDAADLKPADVDGVHD